MLAQALGKVWVWNCVCYGELRREILADFCHSLSPGVKPPELWIGTVVTLQEQGRCIDSGPGEVGRAVWELSCRSEAAVPRSLPLTPAQTSQLSPREGIVGVGMMSGRRGREILSCWEMPGFLNSSILYFVSCWLQEETAHGF